MKLLYLSHTPLFTNGILQDFGTQDFGTRRATFAVGETLFIKNTKLYPLKMLMQTKT